MAKRDAASFGNAGVARFPKVMRSNVWCSEVWFGW